MISSKKKQRKLIHSGNLSLKRKGWLAIEHLTVTAAARFFCKRTRKGWSEDERGEGKMWKPESRKCTGLFIKNVKE
jgi:hypothetical protein